MTSLSALMHIYSAFVGESLEPEMAVIAAHDALVNAAERQIILQITGEDARSLIRRRSGIGPGTHPEFFVAHEKPVLANPVLAR